MTKESRFAEGPIPVVTDEKVVEVKEGVVVRKEVDGTIYVRRKNVMTGDWLWESEGTPFHCSVSSEHYWSC